jgi:hypothetical protein
MIADRKRETRKTEKPEYQTKVPKEDRRKKGKSKTHMNGMDGINRKSARIRSQVLQRNAFGGGDRRNLHLEPGLVSRRGQVCTVVEP